ncbi:hypothetical protein [Nonomuraea endophytica]|uniref:RiboL-PSP-HEPN domain-containing protein n=1 Tax=Nonomuraea endophytica TaxID=714136 RepID=A0A7W8A9K6_9ACTN|nr:hypothetical protein [Nonomuraea endophytica]MBB5082172.1 hypothetical protein [Nonomuraea endophytica]
MPPIQELKQNLHYARQIVRGGRLLAGLGVSSFDVDDLYRAAWVQAVAALDHWAHEEIYHRAVAIAQRPGDSGKPRKFLNFEIPMRLVEEVNMGFVSWETGFHDQLKKSLAHRAFQNPAKIKEGFSLVTDLQLWDEVAKVLTAHRSDGRRVVARELIHLLTTVANRRNKISHEADRDPDQRGAKMAIDADAVQEVIDLLETVAAAIVEALDHEAALPAPQPAPVLPMQNTSAAELAQRFDTLLSRHQEAPAVLAILDRWTKLGGSVTYSDGDTSCLLILDGEDFDYWAVAVHPFSGKIHITFDQLSRRPPFDDVALRRELRLQVNDIPGVALPDDSVNGRPGFPIAALHGPGTDRLWAALEWFASQVPRE